MKDSFQKTENQDNTETNTIYKLETIEIQESEKQETVISEKRENKERRRPENKVGQQRRRSERRDGKTHAKTVNRDNSELTQDDAIVQADIQIQEEMIVQDDIQVAESQARTEDKQAEKRIRRENEYNTIDNHEIIGHKKIDMPEEEEFKITWPLHDSMAKQLTKDFHRGCRINAATYETGSNVLRHGQCKLDSFNWLKDYENETIKEGELSIAEVRFKNDRKDFFSYPSELRLSEGELVVVETAIGHDVGIVSLVGEIVERQRKRKKKEIPVTELKKILRRA